MVTPRDDPSGRIDRTARSARAGASEVAKYANNVSGLYVQYKLLNSVLDLNLDAQAGVLKTTEGSAQVFDRLGDTLDRTKLRLFEFTGVLGSQAQAGLINFASTAGSILGPLSTLGVSFFALKGILGSGSVPSTAAGAGTAAAGATGLLASLLAVAGAGLLVKEGIEGFNDLDFDPTADGGNVLGKLFGADNVGAAVGILTRNFDTEWNNLISGNWFGTRGEKAGTQLATGIGGKGDLAAQAFVNDFQFDAHVLSTRIATSLDAVMTTVGKSGAMAYRTAWNQYIADNPLDPRTGEPPVPARDPVTPTDDGEPADDDGRGGPVPTRDPVRPRDPVNPADFLSSQRQKIFTERSATDEGLSRDEAQRRNDQSIDEFFRRIISGRTTEERRESIQQNPITIYFQGPAGNREVREIVTTAQEETRRVPGNTFRFPGAGLYR